MRDRQSGSQSPAGNPHWGLWPQFHPETLALDDIPSETLGTRICIPQIKNGRVLVLMAASPSDGQSITSANDGTGTIVSQDGQHIHINDGVRRPVNSGIWGN